MRRVRTGFFDDGGTASPGAPRILSLYQKKIPTPPGPAGTKIPTGNKLTRDARTRNRNSRRRVLSVGRPGATSATIATRRRIGRTPSMWRQQSRSLYSATELNFEPDQFSTRGRDLGVLSAAFERRVAGALRFAEAPDCARQRP